MILGSDSKDVFEAFKAAKLAENVAITKLANALRSGVKDDKTLLALVEGMETAGEAAEALWEKLDKARLDR